MKVYDAAAAAALLPFGDLVREVEGAALRIDRGEIASAARLVPPLSGEGVLLAMPATAADIGVHTLVKPDMASIDPRTRDGSTLYRDDLAGVRREVGDLPQAGVDWEQVRTLASALRDGGDLSRPRALKTVGSDAWNPVASRVALQHMGFSQTAIDSQRSAYA